MEPEASAAAAPAAPSAGVAPPESPEQLGQFVRTTSFVCLREVCEPRASRRDHDSPSAPALPACR